MNKNLLTEVKNAMRGNDPSLLELKAYKYLQEELPLKGLNDKTKLRFYARMIDAIEEMKNTGKYSFYTHFNSFRKDIPEKILREDIEGVLADIFKPSVSDYKWSFGKDYLQEENTAYGDGVFSTLERAVYNLTHKMKPQNYTIMKTPQGKYLVCTKKRMGQFSQKGYKEIPFTEWSKDESKEMIKWGKINESLVMHDSWWNMKKEVRINKAGIVKWSNSPFVEIGAELSTEDMGKLADMGFSLIPCQ